MKLLIKNGVALQKSKIAEVVESGVKLDDFVFAVTVEDGVFTQELPEIIDIDELLIPNDFIPEKYLYDSVSGFVINPVYENSVQMQIQTAIDEYTMSLIEGGLL